MDEVIGGTWHNAQSVDLHVRGRIRSATACQAGCCTRSVRRTELSAGAAGKRTPSRIGGRQAVGGFGIGACSERRHDIGGLAATQRAVHGVGGVEDRADRGNADRRAAIKESWVADRGNDDRRAAIKGVYLCVCVWRMLM